MPAKRGLIFLRMWVCHHWKIRTGGQTGEQKTATAAPSVDDLFVDFIRRSIRQRLDAVGLPRLDSYKTKASLPFILSPDFADHFEQILKTEFLPALAKSVPGFLQQVESKHETERQEFLGAALEDRQYRATILESWKTVWLDLTETKALPKKPTPAASAGLINRLVDKVKDKPSRRKEMTPEQWKTKVKEVKKANAQAEKNWAAIARDDGKYLPPQEQDKRLLMDLLARSVSGMEKQVTALRQIASQGGSVKAFDAYAKGRDLDVNGTKEKKLNNIRTVNKDEALILSPPVRMGLEEAIQWIAEDELVEITPVTFRIRKRALAANQRPKKKKKKEA